MEITIPAPTDAAQSGAAQWRRLDGRLWVARRDGAPIGMVEEGRRFVATDAEDALLGRFRTLAEARAAVEAGVPQARLAGVAAAPWVVTGISLLVAGSGGAALLLGS